MLRGPDKRLVTWRRHDGDACGHVGQCGEGKAVADRNCQGNNCQKERKKTEEKSEATQRWWPSERGPLGRQATGGKPHGHSESIESTQQDTINKAYATRCNAKVNSARTCTS